MSGFTRKRQDKTQHSVTKKSLALPGLREEEKLILKSLQMPHDERYDAMDHYRQHGGTADGTGHFARICQRNRKMHGLTEQAKKVTQNADFGDIATREVEDETFDFDGERILRVAEASVAKRVDWQESFDREVKRLFVDFELTESAGCRLNHLERMHTWFTQHGAKQTRKDQKGPSYILVEDNSAPLPGSTRHVPRMGRGPTSTRSVAFSSPLQSPALTARSNQ